MEDGENTSKKDSLSSVHWDPPVPSATQTPFNVGRLAKRKLTPFVHHGSDEEDSDCPRCLFRTTNVLAFTAVCTVALELLIGYAANASVVPHMDNLMDAKKGIELFVLLSIVLVAQIGLYKRWYLPLLPLFSTMCLALLKAGYDVSHHVALYLHNNEVKGMFLGKTGKFIMTMVLRVVPIFIIWLYTIYVMLRCILYLRHKAHLRKLSSKRKLSDAEVADDDLIIYDRRSPEMFTPRATTVRFMDEVNDKEK